MESIKDFFKRLFAVNRDSKSASLPAAVFPGSDLYWDNRYKSGGDSGVGSYGCFAQFKADTLNKFTKDKNIREVIEFGCGDGNQLSYFKFPHYIGFDISAVAISACREKYVGDQTKEFHLLSDYKDQQAELSLSLDVIYHLVEDDIFNSYMRHLFGASSRFVGIYSSDSDKNSDQPPEHVRHRCFTDWIRVNMPEWVLVDKKDNLYPYEGDYREGSWSDFYFYEKK